MTRVLVFVGYYLPGFKGGGPIRSIANLVERLGDRLEFRVVALDHDLGDTTPYPQATPGAWIPVGHAQVRYLGPQERGWSALQALLRDTPHDLLYLNGLFSPTFSLLPLLLRHLGRIPRRPVVVAPRGELSPGALALKSGKKRLVLALSRLLGLHADVTWQATGAPEAAEIAHHFGPAARVVLAPNLGSLPAEPPPRAPKAPGRLRAVFLSRVAPKKNLLMALEALKGVEGDVSFDIYGPLEDAAYWARCEGAIAALLPNIQVRHRGPLPHDQVPTTLAGYDLFVLPTLGENHGHVIAEALAAGTPVLLSDQTPWRGLESLGVGWDLPLTDPAAFTATLQKVTAMDAAAHAALVDRARAHARADLEESPALAQHEHLFTLPQ